MFSISFKTYGPLPTDGWIKHQWKFTYEFIIGINIMNAHKLHIIHGGNKFLTNVFTDLGLYGEELIQLNQCQLFLWNWTLQDVVKGYTKVTTYIICHFNLHAEDILYLWPENTKNQRQKALDSNHWISRHTPHLLNHRQPLHWPMKVW